MESAKKSLFFALFLSSALALPFTTEAGIKCWTNRDGVRECGNAVPPEYAQQETRTINKQGMTTEITERALTKEELEQREQNADADQLRLEEEKRQLEREEQRIKDQQNHDRVLLATFLNEEEILRSRDRKLLAIDANLELTHITIEKLQVKLEAEKARVANLERQGKPIPERTQEDIDSLQKQIDDKQRYQDSKSKERQALIEQYEADIARFRELKGSRNPR